jgi:hypothetical protein
VAVTTFGDVSWTRVRDAVENVRRRQLRAAGALQQAAVPYAVVGGNVVAAWVSRVDEAAVRNTRDVGILLRRTDLDAARTALEQAAFVYRHAGGMDMFLDGADGKARDAVHIVFAAEKVRPGYVLPAPDVSDTEETGPFCLLSLNALVSMKLTSFRDRDRVHLRDLIEVGLVDDGWLGRLPPALR